MISGEKSESGKAEAGPGNQGFGVGREGGGRGREEEESRKNHSKQSLAHEGRDQNKVKWDGDAKESVIDDETFYICSKGETGGAFL